MVFSKIIRNTQFFICSLIAIGAFPIISHADPAHNDMEFIKHTLDDEFQSVSGLTIADLDNDGHLEIIGTAIDSDEIAYWSNKGEYPPVWTKTTITDNYDSAIYVYVADINGDSLNDVIATASSSGRVAWFCNPGDSQTEWDNQIIRENFDIAHGVYAADLDGDEDLDIIATSVVLNSILWWENKGGTGSQLNWQEHTLEDNLVSTQTVCVADLDNDGKNDVIAGSSGEHIIVWYHNDGNKNFTRKPVGEDFPVAHWVHVDDIDADGKLDILAASFGNDELAWWKNSGSFELPWEKQTITKEVTGALTICTGDFDNDNNIDVIGTANAGRKVAWWRNDGKSPIGWTEQVVGTLYRGAWPVAVADLDHDNDLDVVTGSDKMNQVTVWENTLLELELGLDLLLPSNHFVPGDDFGLESQISNPDTQLSNVPIVVLMEISGEYWFWPSWGKLDPETGIGFEFIEQSVENGTEFIEIFPQFEWPDTGSQPIPDIQFMGAMLTSDMTAILGIMDTESCSFGQN